MCAGLRWTGNSLSFADVSSGISKNETSKQTLRLTRHAGLAGFVSRGTERGPLWVRGWRACLLPETSPVLLLRSVRNANRVTLRRPLRQQHISPSSHCPCLAPNLHPLLPLHRLLLLFNPLRPPLRRPTATFAFSGRLHPWLQKLPRPQKPSTRKLRLPMSRTTHPPSRRRSWTPPRARLSSRLPRTTTALPPSPSSVSSGMFMTRSIPPPSVPQRGHVFRFSTRTEVIMDLIGLVAAFAAGAAQVSTARPVPCVTVPDSLHAASHEFAVR